MREFVLMYNVPFVINIQSYILMHMIHKWKFLYSEYLKAVKHYFIL